MVRIGIGIAISAVVILGAAYGAAMTTRRPPTLIWPRVAALLGCLIVALLPIDPPFYFYKGAICLALLILFLGEALMLIPGTPPTLRAGANVVIDLLLWLGYSITAGIAIWSLRGLWGLIPLIIGGLLYYFVFFPRLSREMRLTVGLYMGNATLVAMAAVALFAVKPAAWSFVGMVGALLFIGADLLAGLHAWRRPVRWFPVLWTLLLVLGALVIAASNWTTALEWVFTSTASLL